MSMDANGVTRARMQRFETARAREAILRKPGLRAMAFA